MDGFKQECKLCHNIISDGCFKVIENVTKSIFDILLLQLTLDIETQIVICTACFSKLLAASNFKSTCLYTDKIIIPYIDFENPKPLDLKEIYAKEKGCGQGVSMLHDEEICRLCLHPTSSDNTSIEEVPVDSIQIYIPEIDFAATTNPVICIKCHGELSVHSSFIKDCLEVQKKRRMVAMDVEEILLTVSPIKTEEIEIKPEPVDEETLFEITCDIKKEVHEERNVPLHWQKCLTNTDETRSLYDADDLKPTGTEPTSADYESKECFKQATSKDSNRQTNRTYSRKDRLKSITKGLKFGTYQTVKDVVGHKFLRQKYECHECGFKAKQKVHLKDHELVHKDRSEVQLYKCDECDFETKYSKNLAQHSLKHRNASEVQMYTCDVCQFETKYKAYLKKHKLTHKSPSEVQMYTCDVCDYKSLHKHNLKNHELKHKKPSEAKMYMCDECDYKSVQKLNLQRHYLTHKQRSQVRMFTCDSCEFATKHRRNYKRHCLKHKHPSEVQVYTCDKCDYKSIHKVGLRRHRLRHSDFSEAQMHTCDVCDYKCMQKVDLLRHELMHKDASQVRVYKCDKCEFVSKYRQSLVRHCLKHRDPSELPVYACDDCAFISIYKRSLTQHRLRHRDLSQSANA